MALRNQSICPQDGCNSLRIVGDGDSLQNLEKPCTSCLMGPSAPGKLVGYFQTLSATAAGVAELSVHGELSPRVEWTGEQEKELLRMSGQSAQAHVTHGLEKGRNSTTTELASAQRDKTKASMRLDTRVMELFSLRAQAIALEADHRRGETARAEKGQGRTNMFGKICKGQCDSGNEAAPGAQTWTPSHAADSRAAGTGSFWRAASSAEPPSVVDGCGEKMCAP